ncbi:organic hydroperoxide resistance protein [Bacillus glycinifermentans]|uniref:Organic hydroperoxide resistance protein n=1 Tax=Bacillus glycinifermentans TaxID=1664069 RepID=A0A0T6BL99_9BACI|nr:organic hydroperoxide resistance protein [Bacillus glycinifermentans]ATH95257.1 Organic hydroperoxide resistance protein OhrA [Bacillus glycinifermentans]KRT91408.1 Organic hydroperoxide resistance protein OhrA [Bacillus glycinifermentans]MEC0487029.1 organic hydroperoxide resistance protein [Bacillus glycinifermentans]
MTKPLFTSRATAKGGRDGKVTSSDGVLALELAMPGTPKAKERGDATNPEQLFAAGYAACFDSALQLTAGKARMQIETEVTADVSLLKDEADGGYKLGVKLQVKGTNIEPAELESLVHQAHKVCPYSKAISEHVDVILEILE